MKEKVKIASFARLLYGAAIFAITAVIAVLLLLDSKIVSAGISRGLSICAGVLIPSLFPFMALAGFVSLTDAGAILSAPFSRLTERIFKLPASMAPVILLSMIGGYPVGAKMISEMYGQGRIDKACAERMLCYCVNAGPPFLITAVGAGMFLDRTAGLILLAGQLAATVVIGFVCSLPAKKASTGKDNKERNSSGLIPAFVTSVTGASSAMITMCSFAVLFSGMLQLVNGIGISAWISSLINADTRIISAVISGLFEVTSGCIAAAGIGGVNGFALASMFISFGGFSVIFQIISMFKEKPVNFAAFLISRIAHMLLSTAIALPLYVRFCNIDRVWASAGISGVPVMTVEKNTFLTSACLMCMCTALILLTGEIKIFRRRNK